jgi:hypothetical protein
VRSHLQRFLEQAHRVDLPEAKSTAQVLLGIGCDGQPEFADGRAQTNACEHVLQALARAQVEMHVAGRHQGHTRATRHRAQGFEQRCIGPSGEKFGGHPDATVEALAQLARLRRDAIGRLCCTRQGHVWHQQRHTVIDTFGDVLRQEAIVALVGTTSGCADQFGQIAVAIAIACKQHESCALAGPERAQGELGADDQRQFRGASCQMRAYHAGQRAFVRDGQRCVSEFVCALDQFFRLRSPA